MGMKMTVFWDVAPFSLANISEELTVTIIRYHHPVDSGSKLL
jgi:hypothetical protein